MELPKNWSGVSVATYLEYLELFEDNELTNFTRGLEILILLSDSDDWEDVSTTKIGEGLSEITFINTPPTTINQTISHCDLGKLTLKLFSKLTLAEWIDLDGFISRFEVDKIIALLYRRTKFDEWKEITYEPYQFSIKDRAKLFLDENMEKVFGVVVAFRDYRLQVLDNFKSIFSSMEDEDFEPTEEDEQYLTEREIIEQRESIKKENITKAFAWESLIDNGTNGSWAESERFLDLPAVFVFNMLTMKSVIEKNR